MAKRATCQKVGCRCVKVSSMVTKVCREFVSGRLVTRYIHKSDNIYMLAGRGSPHRHQLVPVKSFVFQKVCSDLQRTPIANNFDDKFALYQKSGYLTTSRGEKQVNDILFAVSGYRFPPTLLRAWCVTYRVTEAEVAKQTFTRQWLVVSMQDIGGRKIIPTICQVLEILSGRSPRAYLHISRTG